MSALDDLAARLGIEPGYLDVRGKPVRTGAETQRLLLAALGLPIRDEAEARAAFADLDRQEWSRTLPPVLVHRASAGDAVIPVQLPADAAGTLAWRIDCDDGSARMGGVAVRDLPVDAEAFGRQRRILRLPGPLPWGYHSLTLDPGAARMALIVTPDACFLPDAILQGRRLWGIAAQLYTLRSSGNWGIGDFADLRRLVEMVAEQGGAVVGVNPLHALFPDNPEHASPYSPASRLLLNILNIALPAPAGSASIEAARETPLVDYGTVAALKLPALRKAYEDARRMQGTAWQSFLEFRAEGGEVLRRGCLFLALRAHFAAQSDALAYWRHWPEPYRKPDSAEVQRFERDHADAVTFQAWLQWRADSQLAEAAATASALGMPIGLYRDLAVGADSAGAETWANAAAVVSGVQVGAPPDIFNPAGQDWGLPPFHPRALRKEAYRSFIDLLRANMRHAGGLRIDHVMGLLHLFCIPAGRPALDGAYIAYPFEDLIGILALESHRNRCLVVGEDLGTVPPGFRERMRAANILSYRIVFFEQAEPSGDFVPPEAYPASALAVLGSHDLPTLRGWWEGRDIDLKQRYGLLPTEAEIAFQRDLRARDKAALLRALREAGLIGADEPDMSALSLAAHAFLARSASSLAVAQLDDITDEADQVNVPSTSWQHPNWRRKLGATLDGIAASPGFAAIARLFRQARHD